MFPSQSAAMQMSTISDLRTHYSLPDELWSAFTSVAGDPGEDPRLLAVLPANVISAALERARLDENTPLSAVQASHVGLIYSLARRIQHTKGGGDWDAWSDTSPFSHQPMDVQTVTKEPAASVGPERKMKMTQILDQGDDGEFIVQGEDSRAAWYQQYLSTVGGLPAGRGGPHLRTTQRLAEENFGARHGTLRGLCHLRPIWSQSIEGIEVQDVRTDIIRLHDEGVAGPCNIHPVANVLQVVENVPHNAGRSGPRGVARVRDGHRKIVEDVSIGLAFDICCRRSCKVIPVKQTSIKSTDGRKGRETTSGWLQPEQTMGLCVPHPGEGRNVLQNTGSHPCPCMDRVRKSWSPEDTSRAVSLQLPPRWIGRHSTRHGERHRHEGNTTEQPQEEEKVGQRRWRRWRRPQTFKRLGRKERREQRKRRSEMLRLEQRQRALWGLGAGATMCSKGQTSTPLHEVRLPRSSKPKLHEERVRSNAADDNDPKTGAAKQETTEGAKSPNSYTYTYETEDEEEKGRRRWW